MRTGTTWIISLLLIASCSNKDKEASASNWISLRADSINTVTLSDTLVIYESICRGCAYEGTVRFGISDSLEMIKLVDVIGSDNNSDDMEGGSISQDILLKPVRTGTTTIKLYKILSPDTAKEDSAKFRTYTITIKN